MEVKVCDGRVQWKWTVQWKSAMEVDRTMKECNGSGPYNERVQWEWTVQWKSAMEVDRTMEECNGSGPYNGRVQWK